MLDDPIRPPLPPTWRDRVDEALDRARTLLQSPWRVAAAVALAAGVGLAAYVVLRPAPATTPVEATLPLAAPLASSTSTTSTTAAQLVVHAAGAVNAPGVYRLPVGARVDDLVKAAGGLDADADPNRINLAKPLADGEQVYIPRIGEAAATGPNPGSPTSTSGPVNLNTATVEQLDALPGIGPTTAQAIIDHREANGPFESVDDLLDVRGIGPAKLEQIRALVTV